MGSTRHLITMYQEKGVPTEFIELKNEFWFPKMSGGTIATSLLRCTRDVLNLSFHMFPYIEILKVSKNKI